MKKFIAISIAIALWSLASEAQDVYSLKSKAHPRLFFTEQAFQDLRTQLAEGKNTCLVGLNGCMMSVADRLGLDTSPLPFDREKMKATYNGTARKWAMRIISAAYAYRVTSDKKYLKACESNILSFARDFPMYTSGFWLENSEVCMSFAIAYDWLYKSLSAKTKKEMIKAISTIGYDDAEDEKKAWFYKSNHNWNSVCNASLVCAAIATFEQHPERSAAVIKKALETNPLALEGIYYPDGASPEGPSYWDYATNFECMMMMALEDNFGTDFGLSDAPGFKEAAEYRIFAVGNTGRWFNYSDCSTNIPRSCMALWYYAWKYGKTEVLFRDVENMGPKYTENVRALYMAIACAQRIGSFEVSKPQKHILVCGGSVDILMARNGWGRKDAYLGLKAGKIKVNHSHMDLGGFIYERDGLRWVTEFPHPEYEVYRRARKVLGKFDSFDEFYRGPLSHSVMIVDGEKMNGKGHSRIVDSIDSPQRRGGTIDFCDCYEGQLAGAMRSVELVVDGDLEIRDSLAALPDKAVSIRWGLVSEAEIKIVDDGIILEQKGARMKLSTTAPGAVFRKWSSNPADYDDIPRLRAMEPDFSSKANICGFEFSLKAGQKLCLTTKIEKE